MKRDDNTKLIAGELPLDPEADAKMISDITWKPDSDTNKPKTLEQWGWLTQGEPPRRDAILSRVKPKSRDPESDFLIAGKTGMFIAPGGVGKTQTFVQLAIAVATSGEFIQGSGIQALSGGRVLIVCGEEDPLELRRRFYWAMKNLPDDVMQRAAKNIVAVPLAGQSCALQEVDQQSKRIFPTSLFARLKGVVTSEDYRLVLLDPASRFMGPDAEKDNKAATNFVELLEQLTNPENEDTDGKATGPRPAVLIAHHTNKGSRADGQQDANAARGASALTDGVRWVAHLGPVDATNNDRLSLVVVKSNYTSRNNSRVEIKRESGGVLRALTEREITDEAKAKASPKNETKAPKESADDDDLG